MKQYGIAGILVLGVMLTGCSEVEPEKVEPTEEAVEAPETEKVEEETPAEFKVGDTVQYADLKVTLNSVTRTDGGEFDESQNGSFLLIDVKVENTGSEINHISSMMNFVLMDADGYAQDLALLETKGSLDGELGAGRSMAGELSFDVADSEYYEFIFEDPFVGGQAIFKINKEDIQ